MHVICTAGHVDHGKSSLVRALTGMQPDRFAEEQRRGLTIDLGFAWFDVDDEHTVAFVDLPGHERFIGNMLAGAGPVEIALLVVAANEGWMPQSREHLQILDLLGVRHGVVALTKIDTVDGELVELAELEVLEGLEGTSLEGARIVRTSAQTGEGLDALRAALRDVCHRVGVAADRRRPRLWIDRAFTVRGAGTVVTGTLGGGALRTGDELALLPSGAIGRARTLQSLDVERDVVRPGSRVAVNLAGVDRGAVERGHALVRAGQWRPTQVFDAWIRVLAGHRVRHTGAWHVHIGSSEHVARVWPLADRQIVGPGEGPVRIVLATASTVEVGDRLVLREVGRAVTVGGGPVLDPAPPQRPRGESRRRERTSQLEARHAALGDRGRLAALHVAERGAAPIAETHALVGVGPDTRTPATVETLGEHYADGAQLQRWGAAIREALARYHRAHPLQRTAPRPVVDRAATAHGCPAAVIDDLVSWCEQRELIVREAAGLRLPDHRVALDAAQRRARDALLAALDATPFAPPGLMAAAKAAGVSRPLLAEMEAAGQLVRLANDIAMTAAAVEHATALLRDAAHDGPLTASAARQVLGTSRKYVLPLLEELDRRGITRRSGDTRAFV